MDIEYDEYGRMNYNPEFHCKNGTPWSFEDINYLIEWYDKTGPEEMSFALDRTIKSIMQYVSKLRKDGLMPTAPNKWHKRMGR